MPDQNPKPRQRQLRNARILETSGVDFPAHLHKGWLLQKSASPDSAGRLLAAIGKEKTMPEPIALLDVFKGLTTEQVTEFQKSVTAEQLTAVQDQVAEVFRSLRDLVDASDPDVPSTSSTAETAPVVPGTEALLASADLQKAIGTDGVALLRKMQEDLEKSQAEAALEKAARLDETSITKAATDFAGLELDFVKFAPALRRFTEAHPEAAAELTKALTSTKELNSTVDGMLLREIGKSALPVSGSPADQLQTIAKQLVEKGEAKTMPEAFAKALELHPHLYEAHRQNQGA